MEQKYRGAARQGTDQTQPDTREDGPAGSVCGGGIVMNELEERIAK